MTLPSLKIAAFTLSLFIMGAYSAPRLYDILLQPKNKQSAKMIYKQLGTVDIHDDTQTLFLRLNVPGSCIDINLVIQPDNMTVIMTIYSERVYYIASPAHLPHVDTPITAALISGTGRPSSWLINTGTHRYRFLLPTIHSTDTKSPPNIVIGHTYVDRFSRWPDIGVDNPIYRFRNMSFHPDNNRSSGMSRDSAPLIPPTENQIIALLEACVVAQILPQRLPRPATPPTVPLNLTPTVQGHPTFSQITPASATTTAQPPVQQIVYYRSDGTLQAQEYLYPSPCGPLQGQQNDQTPVLLMIQSNVLSASNLYPSYASIPTPYCHPWQKPEPHNYPYGGRGFGGSDGASLYSSH